MTSTPLPVRRALLVHAHPEPGSFSTAQADAVADQLRSGGTLVEVIDLYGNDWDPVLSHRQFPHSSGYFKPQAEQLHAVTEEILGDPVKTHLGQLRSADLLVLSFPLWWFSMPAIMKGWVDRVFVMGAAFGGQHGIFADAGLRGKSALLLLTTGGAQESFQSDNPEGYGDLDQFLFHIHRGMLEFVGYHVLPPIITYQPARLDQTTRAAALTHAREQILRLVPPTPSEPDATTGW